MKTSFRKYKGLIVALTCVLALSYGLLRSEGAQTGVAPNHKAVPLDPDAQKVEKIIQTIIDLDAKRDKTKPSKSSPQTFTVTEKELNAYINYRLKVEEQKTIKSMVVNLNDRNAIFVTSLVDFNQIKVPADSGAAFVMRLLSGTQTVKVNGTLNTSRGKGTFQLDRAELNGMSLPPALVNRLIKMFGEKQTPPFDPTKPFDLPYGVQEVEIHKGYAKIKV